MDFINSNAHSANNNPSQPLVNLVNGSSPGPKPAYSSRLTSDPMSTSLTDVSNEMLNQQIHLYNEIEQLRSQLNERDRKILEMETLLVQDAQKAEQIQQNINSWEEKYKRLLESHRKVHKINQTLEDKLLTIVEKSEADKGQMATKIEDLQKRLEDARILNSEIETENSQYREFVVQRFKSLPTALQDNVRRFLRRKRLNAKPWDMDAQVEDATPLKPMRVPVPTFPPTAMVYTTASVPDLSDALELENGLGSSQKITEAIIDLILEGDSSTSLGISNKHLQYRRQQNNSEVILIDEAAQTDYTSVNSATSLSFCPNCDHHRRNLSCPDFEAMKISPSPSHSTSNHYYHGSRSTNGSAVAPPTINRSNRPQQLAAVRLKKESTIIDI